MLITIIGVLASAAIPAYQDYTGRAQFAEGMVLAASLKQAAIIHYGSEGECPRTFVVPVGNIAKADTYTSASVSEVVTGPTHKDGWCFVQSRFRADGVNPKLADGLLKIAADMRTSGSIQWICASTADKSVRSASCKYNLL